MVSVSVAVVHTNSVNTSVLGVYLFLRFYRSISMIKVKRGLCFDVLKYMLIKNIHRTYLSTNITYFKEIYN